MTPRWLLFTALAFTAGCGRSSVLGLGEDFEVLGLVECNGKPFLGELDVTRSRVPMLGFEVAVRGARPIFGPYTLHYSLELETISFASDSSPLEELVSRFQRLAAIAAGPPIPPGEPGVVRLEVYPPELIEAVRDLLDAPSSFPVPSYPMRFRGALHATDSAGDVVCSKDFAHDVSFCVDCSPDAC